MIAGAGDDGAGRARRRGELRASHADRERVIDTLKAAYVYGLVTKDELDERVGQTLASRTGADLALVTADIPAGLPAPPQTLSPEPAKADAPVHAGQRSVDRAVAASAALSALAFVAAVLVGSQGGTDAAQAGALIALAAAGSALVSMFLVAAHAARSRRDKRSGGQVPPGRAIDTGRSELPRTSQPRRGTADVTLSRSLSPGLST